MCASRVCCGLTALQQGTNSGHNKRGQHTLILNCTAILQLYRHAAEAPNFHYLDTPVLPCRHCSGFIQRAAGHAAHCITVTGQRVQHLPTGT